jgi:hypothetical protein
VVITGDAAQSDAACAGESVDVGVEIDVDVDLGVGSTVCAVATIEMPASAAVSHAPVARRMM